MSKRYDHVFTIAFAVTGEEKTGPTYAPDVLRLALLRRLALLDDVEFAEALGMPDITCETADPPSAVTLCDWFSEMPWWLRMHAFRNLEIDPCRHLIDHDDPGIAEICEPKEAEFWTVFGHLRTGGRESLRDFPTKYEAQEYVRKVIRAFPHLGVGFAP